MKRTLRKYEFKSCETKQPKLEIPVDHQSNQKPRKGNHDERSEQPLQISRVGADNETKRGENDIEEVDTQQEKLSSSVPSSSEDFIPRSDASMPVQKQEGEIERVNTQQEELSSSVPSSSEDFTPTNDTSILVQKQEGEIEKVNTQQEELSSSVSSSSESFTPTSDASIPVEEQQEDEIEQIARKAVNEATIRRYPSRYYYHYTPLNNLNNIRKDGYLFAAKPTYAKMKKGIYVTTMPPFRRTGRELRECVFKGGRSLKTRRKLESYVALNQNDVSRACSKIENLRGRPKCLRLVPKNNLYLKEVEHYCGPRSATGKSDTEPDQSDTESD